MSSSEAEASGGSGGASELDAGPAWPARLGAGIAVALALLSLFAATDWAHNRQELLDLLGSSGVTTAHPHVARNASREPTPHQARLLAARALVYHVISLHSLDTSAAEREAVAGQLPEAATLARRALEQQPNSWQAAMILGMATYLERSLSRDRRLYTASRAWEAPLEKAVRDGAGYPEPRRLLASVYLESWHALSAEKRELTKGLLKQVFEDDLRAFEALAPAWLGLGLDTEVTFSVLPDVPGLWESVKRACADAEQWQRYRLAHARYLDALKKSLEARRAEAVERLRLGDFFRARSRMLEVIVKAPPSGRFAPLVTQALETYPPGLHGLSATDLLEEWLDWALELDRVGVRLLSPVAVARLLDAVGEIDAPKAAAVALLAEDRYQAERFAKLAQPLTMVSWSPYLLARSKALLEAGDLEGTRNVLSMVSATERDDVPFLLLRARVADALGDVAAGAIAEEKLEAERRRSWTALDWRWRRGRPVLELLADGAAGGFEVEIVSGHRPGAVVEIGVDGQAVDLRVVHPGERVRVRAPIEAGPHQITVR
ncbi:MAG: hypothetical protein MI919_12670, partial [Holophagales bacterium]|nr:hypothetical protein [Holophagales bacterium]